LEITTLPAPANTITEQRLLDSIIIYRSLLHFTTPIYYALSVLSGCEHLITLSTFLYMVLLRGGKITTTLANARIKLKVEIGASSICLFYGRDIYDAATNQIFPIVPTTIANRVVGYMHQIGGRLEGDTLL
jgi:hypothetical protein